MPRIRTRNDWLSRAWTIVIAYAFAVQMLLGSIIATQMAITAPIGVFAICAPDATANPETPDQPAQLHHQAPCSICAFASLSPPLPALAAQLSIGFELADVGERRNAETPIARRLLGPRTSQGPPPTY